MRVLGGLHPSNNPECLFGMLARKTPDIDAVGFRPESVDISIPWRLMLLSGLLSLPRKLLLSIPQVQYQLKVKKLSQPWIRLWHRTG